MRLIRRRAKIFLSTPSARRATPDDLKPIHKLSNFYPRPPRGGRLSLQNSMFLFPIFLSTPSARRATQLSKVP